MPLRPAFSLVQAQSMIAGLVAKQVCRSVSRVSSRCAVNSKSSWERLFPSPATGYGDLTSSHLSHWTNVTVDDNRQHLLTLMCQMSSDPSQTCWEVVPWCCRFHPESMGSGSAASVYAPLLSFLASLVVVRSKGNGMIAVSWLWCYSWGRVKTREWQEACLTFSFFLFSPDYWKLTANQFYRASIFLQ